MIVSRLVRESLPSEIFLNCEYSKGKTGFFECRPKGINHVFNLFLNKETTADDTAVQKATAFFDQVVFGIRNVERSFARLKKVVKDIKSSNAKVDMFQK